jgi:hypothetical protein
MDKPIPSNAKVTQPALRVTINEVPLSSFT